MIHHNTERLITVRELLQTESLHLRLVEGAAGLDRGIRWAHATDLLDPSPWLRGEEFVMTMGSALQSPQASRIFVDAIVDLNASGIGFGVQNFHPHAPSHLRDLCRERAMPLLEIPYEVSFLSIIELMAERLAAKRSEALVAKRRWELRLLAALDGPDGLNGVARVLTQEFGSTFVIANQSGRILVSVAAENEQAPVSECIAAADLRVRANHGAVTGAVGEWVGDFVGVSRHGVHLGWVGWVHRGARAPMRMLQILLEVVPIVSVGLTARRDATIGDWRHVGRLFELIVDGVPAPLVLGDLVSEMRLDPSALTASAWKQEAAPKLSDGLPNVLIGLSGGWSIAVTDKRVDVALEAAQNQEPVGIGSTVVLNDLGTSLREALSALLLTRPSRSIVTWSDLATFEALLEQQPFERLATFSAQLIDPLVEYASDSLVGTLRTFFEEAGAVERTAVRLGIHPNSVRHRLHRINALVGKDPLDFVDRAALYVGLWAWDHSTKIASSRSG